ncbi:hypothetical protein L4C34_03035 [Vibrio profundum]|uniref:hypothetical protein n=1 Tax=Vibrio profundum TaxID=2910247 RepID=UPI003D0C56D3
MGNTETFNQLIQQVFDFYGFTYAPSDVYHVKLDSPQVNTMLVAFFSIDDKYAALVSELRVPFVPNTMSEWLLQRNSYKQQIDATYCLIKDDVSNSIIMAQTKFSYQNLELPEVLSLYETFTREIITCNGELQAINEGR